MEIKMRTAFAVRIFYMAALAPTKSACSKPEQALCFVTYTAKKNFTKNRAEMT